jgi:regulator of cell morphogenesis and NO signaling
MHPETNKTVRQIAIETPASVRVFESLGIDYCCGGRRPLEEACQLANVPLERAVALLAECGRQVTPGDEDWNAAGVGALVEHIVTAHHAFVRSETPRLTALANKVVQAHGERHPELLAIRDHFLALTEELGAHMNKEENVLFPFVTALATAAREGRPAPTACFDSVETPISRMLADHDDAGALLAKIRELAGDFEAPANACPSYKGLYHGLQEFERDLHRHVHLENNILFPRALELEQSEAAYVRA